MYINNNNANDICLSNTIIIKLFIFYIIFYTKFLNVPCSKINSVDFLKKFLKQPEKNKKQIIKMLRNINFVLC